MFKKIASIIIIVLCGGFLATFMMYAAQKGYKKDRIQLSELSFYKGPLLDFHIDYTAIRRSGRYGVGNRKFKFLAIVIAGLDQTMGVGRPEQEYDDIINNIKIGDTVTIYYRMHSSHYMTFTSGINFNDDIYQLDINNKNYIQIDKVKSNHAKGDLVVLICGIFMYTIIVIYVIVTIRKMRFSEMRLEKGARKVVV